MEQIKLSLIDVDTEQPRKLFDSNRLNELMKSISVHGIMTPLIVERQLDGRYLLVDGERRYRAAKELKLSEVPARLIAPANTVQRLIQQYHIQEQHESWSNTEKAMAIWRLSEETNMKMTELASALDIPKSTCEEYYGFAKLIAKDKFLKSKINLTWASRINSIKDMARKITQNVLEKPFNLNKERDLENAIIDRIIRGDFKVKTELVKLKDSFTKDPKSIQKFIDTPATTVVDLFRESGAKGTYHLRNIKSRASELASHGKSFLKIKDIKIDDSTIAYLKDARKVITDLLNLVE